LYGINASYPIDSVTVGMNERILLDNYAFGIGKINEILSDV